MGDSTEELLKEIDLILDQLMENGAALKSIASCPLFINEEEALKKTQESLLARLMHRQALIETQGKQKLLKTIRKETLEAKIIECSKNEAFILKRHPAKSLSISKKRKRSLFLPK